MEGKGDGALAPAYWGDKRGVGQTQHTEKGLAKKSLDLRPRSAPGHVLLPAAGAAMADRGTVSVLGTPMSPVPPTSQISTRILRRLL